MQGKAVSPRDMVAVGTVLLTRAMDASTPGGLQEQQEDGTAAPVVVRGRGWENHGRGDRSRSRPSHAKLCRSL